MSFEVVKRSSTMSQNNMFRLMIVRLMQEIGKELMRKCEQYVQCDDSQTNAEDWKGTDEKM